VDSLIITHGADAACRPGAAAFAPGAGAGLCGWPRVARA
jgi:hypothetical protein